jgi:FAD/FMN-containing dehydrogenase
VIGLGALTGLTAYDPAECVVTALAGTPVRHLADTLAAYGQYLPWDPPIAGDGATVGGMIASGLSGPGRYRYGGVRDFVIGARVVDGRGRLIASGGQVVKNAAGFLLHHALVGSAGRLGVIAEVSLKVFPRAEATRTSWPAARRSPHSPRTSGCLANLTSTRLISTRRPRSSRRGLPAPLMCLDARATGRPGPGARG